jgi:hypothetical protein
MDISFTRLIEMDEKDSRKGSICQYTKLFIYLFLFCFRIYIDLPVELMYAGGNQICYGA